MIATAATSLSPHIPLRSVEDAMKLVAALHCDVTEGREDFFIDILSLARYISPF